MHKFFIFSLIVLMVLNIGCITIQPNEAKKPTKNVAPATAPQTVSLTKEKAPKAKTRSTEEKIERVRAPKKNQLGHPIQANITYDFSDGYITVTCDTHEVTVIGLVDGDYEDELFVLTIDGEEKGTYFIPYKESWKLLDLSYIRGYHVTDSEKWHMFANRKDLELSGVVTCTGSVSYSYLPGADCHFPKLEDKPVKTANLHVAKAKTTPVVPAKNATFEDLTRKVTPTTTPTPTKEIVKLEDLGGFLEEKAEAPVVPEAVVPKPVVKKVMPPVPPAVIPPVIPPVKPAPIKPKRKRVELED